MHSFRPFLVFLLAASCNGVAVPRHLSPRQGGGIAFNVGQNYEDEWQGFANAIRKPSGISVYGDIYSGALNPDSQKLLASYAQSNTGNVEIGFSWKDAMTSNGYTQYQGAQLQNDISSGKFDTQLKAFASYLTQYPNVNYLMRVEYEVSPNIFANTNPSTFDESTFDLTAYPAAYRHVRNIIAAQNPNVKFVYHSVRAQAQKLYPGDDVVDFIGFSVFNNDVCLPVSSTTNCEGKRADDGIVADIQWAPKPKIVAESAVQPPASATQEGIEDFLGRIKELVTTNPGFVGWTYINSDWPAHGWDPSTWGDSRVEVQDGVREWFQQNVAGDSAFVFG